MTEALRTLATPPPASRVVSAQPPLRSLLRHSAFAVQHQADELAATGRDVIHLELGEPDLPTAAHIVSAMVSSARDGWTHYTAPAGDPEIRQHLAGHYARLLRMPVAAEQVLLVPGSNMVLHFALLTLVAPGDEVLLPDPGFPVYAELVRLAGGVPVSYPLRGTAGFAPDIAELAARVTARTRLLVVNSPHNPTGAVLLPETARELTDLVRRHSFYVLRDEAYRGLNWTGVDTDALLAELPPERVIVSETLSKSHAMCGWRAGIMVAPPHLAADFAVLMTNTNCCMPAFVQRALPAALTAPETASWSARYAAEYRARRDLTVTRLLDMPSVRLTPPMGAFYAFPDISDTGLPDVVFAQRLLAETGVAVMPGSSYGRHGRGHVRLSFTQPPDRLTDALDRMHRFLAELA
ncbi:pyridoxal phosphate-dependent aminotransferase [Verrucosispora sp. WMMD1129]|uniref:pyridoxal phosphate-dependent aminotransferase n=1 Tax=Verrucosispora sp. WMMD1129 TaxID=3016093 RepID=UPI00249C2541|nr:pyridoxal phosphate-dependent aminotransferase [Verrucosispora sp. WMMD1129]WFE47862.1 pyridoxal phosphate-dependent aminotransferase [Verrucosispora sp. WMMD1129]